jgi:hypothetical protein
MNEQERAEEHLRTIRRLMERGTIYRAISAPTALVGGVLSLVASGVYLKYLEPIPFGPDGVDGFNNPFFQLWLLVFVLVAGCNTLLIVAGARKRNEPVFSASMKAALVALAPAFIAAAALTIVIVGTSSEPNGGIEIIVSILWAIFYGLGLLATSHFAPHSLTILGWAFLLSGIAGVLTLGHGGEELPNHIETLFMAATFGLFHLIYAACAWPRKGAAPEL